MSRRTARLLVSMRYVCSAAWSPEAASSLNLRATVSTGLFEG